MKTINLILRRVLRFAPVVLFFAAALAALPDPKWTASDELTVVKLDRNVYVVVHERQWPAIRWS